MNLDGDRLRPPLVAHIIYALGTGGLENGLVNIINRSSPGRYRHAIICLTTAEAFAGRQPAAIWIPYEWSRSTGNLFEDRSGGRFGHDFRIAATQQPEWRWCARSRGQQSSGATGQWIARRMDLFQFQDRLPSRRDLC